MDERIKELSKQAWEWAETARFTVAGSSLFTLALLFAEKFGYA